MEIEPPNLNIPLKRSDRWVALLVATCVGVTFVSAFFNPSFASAFAGSTIAGVPVLLVFAFPPRIPNLLLPWRGLRTLALWVFVFGYIDLARTLLVPLILQVFERVST